MGKFVKELDNSDRRRIEAIPRKIENSALEILNSLREIAQNLIQQR